MSTWQIISTLLVLAVVAAVAALGVLNAGRTVSSPRPAAPAPTVGPTLPPTPAVTPRVLTTAPPTPRATPTTEAAAIANTPPAPPTATPPPAQARIGNTAGVGVVVRAEPGPQARAVGNLREGTRVNLTGGESTVAARQWREVEDPSSGLKGWVSAEFLLPPQ